MTSLKSSGKIDFPENLEQEWGWSHDPVWGVHRILHFLAFIHQTAKANCFPEPLRTEDAREWFQTVSNENELYLF